jgi:predicted methyltransferase
VSLAKPALKNVVRVDREFEDPLPADAKNLDAVFVVLFYHDTVWMGADRDKMNRAVFAALKPGGRYIVVDHSAKDGSGVNDVKSLHRIEERVVVDEVTRAGFHLAAVGDFLRNPSDMRDWNDSPMAVADRRGKSDRFVLKFDEPEFGEVRGAAASSRRLVRVTTADGGLAPATPRATSR